MHAPSYDFVRILSHEDICPVCHLDYPWVDQRTCRECMLFVCPSCIEEEGPTCLRCTAQLASGVPEPRLVRAQRGVVRAGRMWRFWLGALWGIAREEGREWMQFLAQRSARTRVWAARRLERWRKSGALSLQRSGAERASKPQRRWERGLRALQSQGSSERSSLLRVRPLRFSRRARALAQTVGASTWALAQRLRRLPGRSARRLRVSMARALLRIERRALSAARRSAPALQCVALRLSIAGQAARRAFLQIEHRLLVGPRVGHASLPSEGRVAEQALGPRRSVQWLARAWPGGVWLPRARFGERLRAFLGHAERRLQLRAETRVNALRAQRLSADECELTSATAPSSSLGTAQPAAE